MSHFKIKQNDLFFILKEQLDYGSLCSLDRYKGLNEETLDLLVKEALSFARDIIAPLQEIGDQNSAYLINGKVFCPKEFKPVFRQYGEAGYTAASRDAEYGGQGFPHMMRVVINDLMYGACHAFNIAPSLTHGAAHLIESFAEKKLKDMYVERMFNGEWSGTMCLTEPQAGSNLSNIETTAIPDGEYYKIKGTKCFISYGEHDLTENIVHLLLARIEGAPAGMRGVSLFVVPKIRVNADGSLGSPNDIVCSSVEKKLGLHGSPTCTLNFGPNDDCIGYLCGEKNKGMAQMFQMVNQARFNTAVTGMTLAGTAYQNALAYTKERKQGYDISGCKSGQVTLIEHPDVRRMLLWMKATVEGMRSMIYSSAFWSDLAHEMDEGPEKRHYKNLVDFMTPIIKAYCSETGFRVCETAIQCFGGYGYCQDYPAEQYLRDVKITSVYEGTSGIQSLDLMGRKMTANGGVAFEAFMKEINGFCDKYRINAELGDKVRMLSDVAKRMEEVVGEMNVRKAENPLQWASSTYHALWCFAEIAMGWRLLDMAFKALGKASKKQFYKAKILQASYFCDETLPLTMIRMERCLSSGREVLDMPKNAF